MRTKLIYGFVSLSLIILAFITSSFLIKSKPETKVDKTKVSHMYVKTKNVSYQTTNPKMKYRGRVTAYDNISLSTEVSGKILKGDIRFKAGEHFKKNQVLINIYSKDVEAALKSSKSSFLQTLSRILPDLQVDFKNEYPKWLDFFKSIDPDKALPELPEIASNQEKVFLASNNVLSSYYNLQQQEINIRKYQIRAPFNGVFKAVNKEIGAVASPSAELAKIIRTDKLEIVVPIFPEDLQWISKGETAQMEGNHGFTGEGIISRTSGFVEENSQSVNIYLSYDNQISQGLLEGEYVDVLLEGESAEGFEIPREALVDEQFVYELKNEKIVKTPIHIVRRLADSYIIDGLDSTQTIVIESLASVNDNINYLSH
jgi:multidrug efflux pump subunit AcrA (membrane-fusion protein)